MLLQHTVWPSCTAGPACKRPGDLTGPHRDKVEITQAVVRQMRMDHPFLRAGPVPVASRFLSSKGMNIIYLSSLMYSEYASGMLYNPLCVSRWPSDEASRRTRGCMRLIVESDAHHDRHDVKMSDILSKRGSARPARLVQPRPDQLGASERHSNF